VLKRAPRPDVSGYTISLIPGFRIRPIASFGPGRRPGKTAQRTWKGPYRCTAEPRRPCARDEALCRPMPFCAVFATLSLASVGARRYRLCWLQECATSGSVRTSWRRGAIGGGKLPRLSTCGARVHRHHAHTHRVRGEF
jgi:hypothetical protein